MPCYFNPRPPCGGRRPTRVKKGTFSHFNPRPPCGGRLHWLRPVPSGLRISIHAPRVGGDRSLLLGGRWLRISIHAPRVGGDGAVLHPGRVRRISIHAPRVGGDPHHGAGRSTPRYFNPRPPCGGRRICIPPSSIRERFQSTPPVWGATTGCPHRTQGAKISIHAPRVGGDGRDDGPISCRLHFNPRPPCGGRHLTNPFLCPIIGVFQSTPPVWGATRKPRTALTPSRFQSTPPVWGATADLLDHQHQAGISIHAPRVGGDSKNS